MSKKSFVTVVIVIVIAALGFAAYRQVSAKRAAAEVPVTETAVVQRDDLVVTVEAAGSLVSSAEFTLTFSASGRLYEFLVMEGQVVEKGDLLARMDDNIQSESDFQALFTEASLAKAELAVAYAEEALDDALGDLKYRIGTVTHYWEGQLKQAEEALAALNADPNSTTEQKSEAQKLVDQARSKSAYFLEQNLDYLEKEDDWRPDAVDIATARLALENAKVGLQDAQAALEIIKNGPSALQAPLVALGPEMAQLEQTRLRMENTRLLAPMNGLVTTIHYQAGEFVNPGAPVIQLNDASLLDANVNLDETDVARISMGSLVVITVDAFPGAELSGEVIEISSTASVQSGVVLYPVTVKTDSTELPLRSGMTVSITFPIEERTNTLLVPFRAIETEGGQAYATRVTASGSERMAVTLGLITDTQVEILGGLEEGDVVTVYANPVQDADVMSNPMFGGGQ